MSTTYIISSKNYSTGETLTESVPQSDFFPIYDDLEANGAAPMTIVNIEFVHMGKPVYLCSFGPKEVER
jgi:hypothetical protein